MPVHTCVSIKYTVTAKHQSPVTTNQGTATFTGGTITTTSSATTSSTTAATAPAITITTTTSTTSKPSNAPGMKSSTVGGDKGLFNY